MNEAKIRDPVAELDAAMAGLAATIAQLQGLRDDLCKETERLRADETTEGQP